MFLIPRRAVYRTRLSPKKLMRKLDGELLEYRPSINILSRGNFMRAHKTESLYYGRRTDKKCEIFYHRAKSRDGGSTGFYGTMEPEGEGTLIKGTYRKPAYVYVITVLWVLVFLACAVGAWAAGEQKGTLIILGIGIVGTFLMLFDRNEKYLREYLEGLPH